MEEKHLLMGGKLHLYKRPNSKYWQCSTYLAGMNRRESTRQETFVHAKEFAEDWYLNLRGMARAGALKSGKTFTFVAETFLKEFAALTAGQRSATYLESQARRVRGQLIPFFDECVLADGKRHADPASAPRLGDGPEGRVEGCGR